MLLLGYVLYNNYCYIGVIVDVNSDSDAAFYLHMLCFLMDVLVFIAINSKVHVVMFIAFVLICIVNVANVICDHCCCYNCYFIVFHCCWNEFVICCVI